MADDEFEEGEPKPKKRKAAPPPEDDDEDEDDRPRRRRRRDADDDSGGVTNVIPYKNGMALAAYYCGVFGLISCFLGLGIFGVIPMILGVLGLMKAAKDDQARGRVHAWIGIGLGALELLTGCGTIGFIIFSAMQDRRRV